VENAKVDDRQWMAQRVSMDLQYASAQIAPLRRVVSLADRAGVTPLADGKIVWAECSASASREVR
jgi:hypothetical protein